MYYISYAFDFGHTKYSLFYFQSFLLKFPDQNLNFLQYIALTFVGGHNFFTANQFSSGGSQSGND